MSRLVPPQFDHYGTTFWIPSQVEPTVALIGTSLPALRQSLLTAAQQVSKVWSTYSASSLSRSKLSGGSSGVTENTVQSASQRSRNVSAPKPQAERRSTDSEVALHTEYYELNDRNKTFQ